MSLLFKQMNILPNIERVYSHRSKHWRQDHTAKDFVSKLPSVTMRSLYEKYKDANPKKRTRILHQMLNVWLAESKNGPVFTETEIDEQKRAMDFVFRVHEPRSSVPCSATFRAATDHGNVRGIPADIFAASRSRCFPILSPRRTPRRRTETRTRARGSVVATTTHESCCSR